MYKKRIWFYHAVILLLYGCSGDKWYGLDKQPIEGKRVAVIDNAMPDLKLTTSSAISLSAPVVNTVWSQAGGNAEHSPGHVALSAKPQEIWRSAIGQGASKDMPLISGPVATENVVFCMDTQGNVSATDLTNGKVKWRVSVRPKDAQGDAIGGGVSVYATHVYVTSPDAEILCLHATTGEIIWRHGLVGPARVSPTVHGGRVFVLTITNELQAFHADTGEEAWIHAGIQENAGILGGASPAADDGVVVVAYTSGEVFALKSENGHELWSEGLIPKFQIDSIASLAHIRARPVVYDDVVYAMSYNDKFVAIKLTTGEQLWTQPVGGLHTPAVDKQTIFVLSNTNDLIALERGTGQMIWRKSLSHTPTEGGENAVKDDNFSWSGPVLAGGQLVITGANGEIRFYNPASGELNHSIKLKTGIPVSPIVVQETLIVLTNDGQLHGFR